MRSSYWGWIIAAIGLLLAAVTTSHLLPIDQANARPFKRVIDAIVLGGSTLGILYGGQWHATNPLPGDRYPRILAEVIAGGLLIGSLGIISLYVGSEVVSITEFVDTLVVSGGVGLAAGLLFGTVEALGIRNAERAARARPRAEALEEERERLNRLNGLLRHYILNSVNVIIGLAEQLQNDGSIPDSESLDRIAEKSTTIATLVQHVRSLNRIDRNETARSSHSLRELIQSQLRAMELSDELTITLPDCNQFVRADPMLRDGIHLLLQALVSVTADDGRIDIDCDQNPSTAAVSMVATPATLPSEIKESLFEPVASGDGIELLLAHELIDQDGNLELVGTDGPTVSFELGLEPISDGDDSE